MNSEPFSLYIHIPYCISKCPYCDFNSHVVAQIPEAGYTDALLRELEYFGEESGWRGRTLQSIFFGGGTPSTFQPTSIGKLLAWVAATFPIDQRLRNHHGGQSWNASTPLISPATATPGSIASASACSRFNRNC